MSFVATTLPIYFLLISPALTGQNKQAEWISVEKNLEGRVAIITGAAQGIGKEIAKALSVRGANVVITDIDSDAGEGAAQEIIQRGYQATFVRTDVADPQQITQLIKQVKRQFGQIDILVNNAGIVSTGPIAEIDLAHWERLIAIDLTAVFLLVKAVLPGMTERRSGRIIHIASVAGQQGGGLLGNSCYAAAKGAVIAFNKGIAREIGPSGVTANVICPALTDTEMTREMPAAQRERIIATMPMGRAGTSNDIAQAVAFLASDDASFITGVTLNVDGGFMRH